ncbi:MAG TPA: YebC/PmpR family DNA-binding transcriptional regulator, partial [Spirochaetes bacterium]|nr:YebC/PmpR family DNA-binding transcriptional regulator [Spirochaetota bacterium]
GHSKWHSIKHKKAATDAKRGKVFTKLIKEITVVARMGGGDLEANPRLRLAVNKAKEANMPGDNIERAIKKGTGELEGVHYEEILYEGYGPEGIAFIMDILTDNRNRTVAEIRKILSKHGGNLGESGSVGWMFEKKGVIMIPSAQHTEDEVMEVALEAGALDIAVEEDVIIVYTSPEGFEQVKNTLLDKNITIENSELTRIPQNTMKINQDKVEKLMNLFEILDDHDDVQSVATNLDFDES